MGLAHPKTPLEEAWHNEQRRKQYDIIRVSNPQTIRVKGITYELPPVNFYIMYDVGQYQKVDYNCKIDLPRYIAVRYIQHKKDDIVNFINKKKHDEYIANRRSKGFPEFKDKATENAETYETVEYPKSNDPEVIREIYEQLWVGIVHEFGRDMPPTSFNSRSGEVDMTPPEMKVIDLLNKRKVNPDDNPVTQFQNIPQSAPPMQNPVSTIPTPISPFANLNEKLTVNDITNNE